MLKTFLMEFCIFYLDKIYKSTNMTNKNKIWNYVKNNKPILESAICIENDKFKSNIIASLILLDKDLYNTEIYNTLINKIYQNKNIARDKSVIKNKTFLILSLLNEDLKLTKEQKIFLIYEAENSPYTEKSYKENKNNLDNLHGTGFFDIRYKILKNINFTLHEKINLFLLFYPDNDLKIEILSELEWEVARDLQIANYEKDYEDIYFLSNEVIKTKINEQKKQKYIIDIIDLCKFIKSIIPEDELKLYKNND